jgi:hypothetical protein
MSTSLTAKNNLSPMYSNKKQSWRIFKKKKFVLNACALSVALASYAISGSASADVLAANALPTGGQYVAGSGSINTVGNNMNINQNTQNGIINFGSFDIGSQAGVNVQNGSGATLGKVTGAGVSRIDGSLNASGSFYLINGNGVVVGKEGRITTGGNFGVSTANIDEAAFKNSGAFNQNGAANGAVANLGSIKSERGNVTIYAAEALNAGSIEAANGTATIKADASTPASMRKLLGDSEYEKIYVDASQVLNTGDIKAAQVDLEARGGNAFSYAINTTGRIRATGVESLSDGKVILTSDGGNVKVDGLVSAQNVDGSGGTVNVGGGYQGKDATIANAANTTITENATIDVSGANGKNAGRAIVWSDNKTTMLGKINASSAAAKGGFVEVSGKKDLAVNINNVNVKGASENGELLLDPNDIVIADGSSSGIVTSNSTVSTNTIFDQDIENFLLAGSLTILTNNSATGGNGDITFNNNTSIEWSTNSSLNVLAGRDINLNGTVIDGSDGTNGIINLIASRDVNFTGNNTLSSGTSAATYIKAAGGNWQTGTGTINFASGSGNNTVFNAKSIYFASGKNANGTRTDFVDATKAVVNSLGSGLNDVFSTIDVRGFNTVDVDSAKFVDGAASTATSPIHATNYLKVYSSNINVKSDLELGSDLHLVAAAFNSSGNYSQGAEQYKTYDSAGESIGWMINTGTVNFVTSGDPINITSCCELVIKTGADSNGDLVDLTSSEASFNYSTVGNEYKLVDISGFGNFETNFEADNLKAIEFVKLRNFYNLINDDINSANVVLYSQDTDLVGSAIGGYNTANAQNVTLVVDTEFFNPESSGTLNIDASSSINANRVAFYTARQSQNNIAGTINGQTFTEGQEFQNSGREVWDRLYSSDQLRNTTNNRFYFGNGITTTTNPFVVYYKNSAPINTPTPQGCESNPNAPGCESFASLINDRVEYRVARATLGSRVQKAVEDGEYLAASNSGMNLPTETFTKVGPTYMDDKLYTLTEKLGTAAWGIPAQIVETVVGGTVGALPGIQGVVDKQNFQTIGGVAGELVRIPSTFLVETPRVVLNIFGGAIGAVGDVVGGVGSAVGNVVTGGGSTTNNPVVQ